MQKLYKIHMGKAECAVDLGDGSERGEYVNQDYILNKLGRPHRSISLMYCYYPLDEQFPQRISEAMKDKKVSFQWDYPMMTISHTRAEQAEILMTNLLIICVT